MKHFLIIWIIVSTMISACTEQTEIAPSDQNDVNGWLIPAEEVLYMNKPKDRIPSIDHPEFIPIEQSNLKDEDIVFIVQHQNVTRVYPEAIVSSHEIVNDVINDLYFAVTYCPLTGSGMAWNRTINDKVTEFGVSGMLFRENLIPYDRNTQSHWSQMKRMCVQGSLSGQIPDKVFLLKTKYSTIKQGYPEAQVLFHTNCDSSVCELNKRGNTLRNEPGNEEGSVLPLDKDYMGVAAGDALFLTDLSIFDEEIKVYTKQFRSNNLLICGSREMMFYTVFLSPGTAGRGTFQPVQNKFPIVMHDEKGNEYDVFGEIVLGPDMGDRLKSPVFYEARTFAWELFYADITVFD